MYINAKTKSKQWLNSFQEQEKNRSNIPSLKVGFNNVFGYYIEITKTHASKVPEDYERRQTLTNSERYTTPELKEMEAKILGAEEQISIIEKEIYADLISQLQQYVIKIQKNAQIISEIDCYQSFAELAHSNKYSKPIMTEDFELEIIAGRHPVVEKLLPKGEVFTANSTNFSNNEIIHILTGPNMSGKSCYLRQNALIVLLAQIGSYVPAESAKIGLVDRIYTRVGAQDNISGGESTFLVEMQEAANIINNATNRSLILLDEVGRGTATFDGISIAWAITEYLHNEIGAKTLFATHYHELNELANKYENVKNYQVEVVESGDSIVFTHKVKLGASNHSFGIYVAQMAGLPKVIIERSKDILSSLEGARGNDTQKQAEKIKAKKKSRDAFSGQLTIFEFKDDELREKIKNIDINIITPIEALKLLNELKNLASK
jgi:DNA mismatch repair protein MutS